MIESALRWFWTGILSLFAVGYFLIALLKNVNVSIRVGKFWDPNTANQLLDDAPASRMDVQGVVQFAMADLYEFVALGFSIVFVAIIYAIVLMKRILGRLDATVG